eukprot:1809773-Amphidinium_carterae.1
MLFLWHLCGEELLQQQMAVVQQALAFNVEINRRLQSGQLLVHRSAQVDLDRSLHNVETN